MAPNKPQVPHYTVVIEGTYYQKLAEGKGKEKAPYSVKTKVPYRVKAPMVIREYNQQTQETTYREEIQEQKIDDVGILSFLIRTKYLHDLIKQKHPDFVGLRTHVIQSVEPSTEDMPLPNNPECLDKVALKKYIRNHNMNIDIALFPQLDDLRAAVVNYKEDPECYKTFEIQWKKRHGVDSAFLNEMEALNADTV